MTLPTTAANCPECGEPMPRGFRSDLGSCPACLFRMGLDEESTRILGDGDRGAANTGSAADPPEVLGQRYRLLAKIGQGGMGVVYLAEQVRPIRRHVAVKLIRRGMDTDQVLARFESERQALALMSHPTIARVFDGGATEDGRPYFVMELVQGRPLTHWCEDRRLGLRERLELFCEVCEGVEHAHQKGIVHRDLKPSNILVDAEGDLPTPKIIDFGVAKAIHGSLNDDQLATQQGHWVGTPAYMSPEQHENSSDIDTRSDVYSLGVILYELLTGRRPYGTPGDSPRPWTQAPPRPSTVLPAGGDPARVAGRRGLRPDELHRDLRGDLDWIVLRAMETNRERRYGSAMALAEDIRRHLEDRPVHARPPSLPYRAGKFARRHWLPVTAAAVVVVALAVGTLVATLQAIRAGRAEARAEEEATAARTTAEFLTEIFRDPDPARARGEELSARALLERGVTRLDEELADQPAIRARLLDTIGVTYMNLGDLDRAEELFRNAAIIRERPGGDPLELAVTVQHLGDRAQLAGDLDTARSHFARALELRRDHGAPDLELAASLNSMGQLGLRRGDYDAAEDALTRSLELRRAVLGSEHEDVAKALNNLGLVHYVRGRYDRALELMTESVEIKTRLLGADHPSLSAAHTNLGLISSHLGRFEIARQHHERALAIDEKIYGPDHDHVAASLNNLAIILRELGEPEEAKRLYERSISIREAVDPDGLNIVDALSNFAMLLTGQGDLDRAEALHRRSLRIRREKADPRHPGTAIDLQGLGDIAHRAGRLEEAERYLVEALALRDETIGPTHDYIAGNLLAYARLLEDMGRSGEAAPLRERALAIHRELGIESGDD